MKKALIVLSLLFFVNSICLAQHSGNRIYGNQGYAKNKRTPKTNVGTVINSGIVYIEASVLLNMKPDSFVAVFSVAQEAQNAQESNQKVNNQIDKFLVQLRKLGINKKDIYIDFITQNKTYDYEIKGDVAEQFLAGFETKKTVAVKYKTDDLLENILTFATNAGIFDLIKVDYIVSDFDSVKKRLFEKAVKIVKQKKERNQNTFGMVMRPIGLAVEKYDAFYPAERYEKYTAFESGTTKSRDLRKARTTLVLRKSSTFFYEPINGSKFDTVLNPIGIEPTVQFTVYLNVQYRLA